MTLQLEAGKYYRSRAGTKVGPITPRTHRVFPWWCATSGWTFTDKGAYFNSGAYRRDLIEEWIDLDNETLITTFSPIETIGNIPVTNALPPLDATLADANDLSIDLAIPDTNPKTRLGMAKPSTFAIPPTAVLHLGRAMENGAGKYGLMNWREHSVSASVYFNAIDRHLRSWQDGEDCAADSGAHHLAHVMACCAIVLDAMECGKLNDDRPHPGVASEMIARLTKTI